MFKRLLFGAAAVCLLGSLAWLLPVSPVEGSIGGLLRASYDGGSNYDYVSMDSSTNSLTFVDYAHHERHACSAYRANISDDDIDTVPLRFKMEIPAQAKRVHLLPFGTSSGESFFTITRNPTGGATGGAGVTPVSPRIDCAGSSTVTLTSGVTAPTGGSLLTFPDPELYGAGKDKVGGATRGSSEWILGLTGSSETYVFELESGTNDVVGNLLLDWYEHTDKH